MKEFLASVSSKSSILDCGNEGAEVPPLKDCPALNLSEYRSFRF